MTNEAIYKELHKSVEGYVLKRVNDPVVAQDIVQDIFLKAHTSLKGLKHSERLGPWLFRIARNTVIDHYRARRKTEPLAEEFSEVPEELESKEMLACILKLTDALPEIYREPLVLSDLEGESQNSVAARLGLSPSGARSRVQRARKMVRENLKLVVSRSSAVKKLPCTIPWI